MKTRYAVNCADIDFLLSMSRVEKSKERLSLSSGEVERSNKKYQYVNGNYVVRGYGRRINILKKILLKSSDKKFISEFPDSIDLKLTNRCSWGCPFCHESSTSDGKTFNLERTKEILDKLPKVPIEIAIGGGNVMEDARNIIELVKWMRLETPFLPRVTLNYKDILRYANNRKDRENKFCEDFDDLMYLVGPENTGVSIQDNPTLSNGTSLVDTINDVSSAFTYHIIAGMFPVDKLKNMIKGYNSKKILVLGYKQFGRAKNDILPKEKLKETEDLLKEFMLDNRFSAALPVYLAFDNLAVEQLNITAEWISDFNNLYFGDEGSHSMYIDAVEETFAKTSRSEKRVSWNDMNVIEFFKAQRDDTINY